MDFNDNDNNATTTERPWWRRIFAREDATPHADYPVETTLHLGLPQAYLIQNALAGYGFYEGEADNEIVSPGVFRPRIEPDMRRALEQYIAMRREEGVELGESLLSETVINDIIANSPADIRTSPYSFTLPEPEQFSPPDEFAPTLTPGITPASTEVYRDDLSSRII